MNYLFIKSKSIHKIIYKKNHSKMGSGISLNHEQIAAIIKQELKIKFEKDQQSLPHCYQDYLIYRDYLEEQKLYSQLKAIDNYVKKGKKIKYNSKNINTSTV